MNNNGFIVLYRSLLDWEWYTDEKVSRLFIHCLLKANHADKKFRGNIIERGSFQTSYQMLSDETGLSVRSIRTSLNKLKTTGEVTIKTSTKNTVIVINNYDEYQSIDKQNDKQTTNKRQTSDKQTTTNNNDNNVNNINKDIIKPLGVVLDEMIDEHTENPDLRKALREFVQYRNSNPKTKISDLGLTKSINQLTKMFGDNTADKIQSIDNTIANGWKGLFDIDKKGDKLTYGWQEELKAEQDQFDNQGYEPKRSAEEAKRKLDEL
jgi:hypothetical protein